MWIPVLDGDDRVRGFYRRHYSCRHYRDGRNPRLFVGPGEKLVLLTQYSDACFIWRKFIDAAIPKQTGVNCSLFRNESDVLSSQLIIEADEIAWEKWGNERLYTYVNPKKIKSTNPGYCYIQAGWTRLPYLTKSGKVVLEILPKGRLI